MKKCVLCLLLLSMLLLAGSAWAGSAGNGLGTIQDYNGKRIGIQTGTTFDAIVLKTLPDAIISYYNTFSDMVVALKSDKIDAFPGDEPVIRLMMAEDSELTILDDRMDLFDYGIAIPKTGDGTKLLAEINEWLASLKKSGELDQIIRKWTDGPESEKTIPDYASFPAPKGVLTMATEAAYAPMDYYRGSEVIGLDIDLAARFCEAHGYGLKVDPMLFDGILPALQSGKADFGMSGITITEERKESVYLSDPYYTGGTVMAVLKSNAAGTPQTAGSAISGSDPASMGEGQGSGQGTAGAESTTKSFFESVGESFHKTFIREDRWQLFVNGVITTLIITVLAVLFGTALGFLVFMLCRNGNVIANGVTRFSMWLVQGMPMVVLLMILYYIIFGRVAINGIFVAVIGFTLTFGTAVFGLLKMGVGAIDQGQYEAAYALGYPNRRTFFRIILPQAIPHILPAYKGEIVGLIKATAIVGYIAVQDLTKIGDIIRSRTYEAFFPLIAITVIYFILEGLLAFLVSRIQIRLNPKKRKPETILKGVVQHD